MLEAGQEAVKPVILLCDLRNRPSGGSWIALVYLVWPDTNALNPVVAQFENSMLGGGLWLAVAKRGSCFQTEPLP